MEYFYSSRHSHSRSQDDPVPGFFALIAILFLLTGLFRVMGTERGVERIEEFETISQSKDRLLAQYHARVEQEQELIASCGIDYGFDEAYKLRYDLYPMFDSLSRINVLKDLTVLEPFLDAAQANLEERRQRGLPHDPMERFLADHEWGFHPLEVAGSVTLNQLAKIPLGIANHMAFFVCVVPLLLIGRVAWRTKCALQPIMKMFGPHLWWLLFCSVLWPVCAMRHAEKDPKETTRFYWLRFAYIFRHRKLFITVAERDALLQVCSTADESVDLVLAKVEAAAQVATGAGQRLAIVSSFCALFSFGGFQLMPSHAVAQETAEQAEVPQDPEIVISGYTAASLTATRGGQTANLDYCRVKPKITDKPWSLATELNLLASPVVKYARIGYDMPELAGLHMKVEAGRVIAPWVWVLSPPNVSPFERTPFDGQLDIPYYDEGAVVFATHERVSWLSSQMGVLNGGGGFSDDNTLMDYSFRLAAAHMHGSVSFAMQRGVQPEGMRSAYVVDGNLTFDPVSFWVVGMERPDIRGRGIASSVVIRAGPVVRFVVQGELSRYEGSSYAYVEGGLNMQADARHDLRLHLHASRSSAPYISASLRKLF